MIIAIAVFEEDFLLGKDARSNFTVADERGKILEIVVASLFSKRSKSTHFKNYRLLLDIYKTHSVISNSYTVNDRLSTLRAYLKTKSFEWRLV